MRPIAIARGSPDVTRYTPATSAPFIGATGWHIPASHAQMIANKLVIQLNIVVLLAGVIELAGCKDDEASVTPDASIPIDAPIPELAGTWRELPPFPTDVDKRTLLTLAPNYTYSEKSEAGVKNGTWSVTTDGLLEIGATESTYYHGPDRLMVGALLPNGTVDGVVGEWKGSYRYSSGTLSQNTMLFRADSTVTFTRVFPTMTSVFEANWNLQAETGLVVLNNVLLDGSPSNNIFTMAIPGVALGSPMYELIDPF